MSQKHDILIKEDFLEQFRSKLPDRYKLLGDDALLKLAYQHNPDIFEKYSIVNRDVINKIDDISWGTLIKGGAKQAWENWKLIPSVMGNMTSQFSNENFAFNNKFIKKYEAREGFLNFLKKTKALREALEKDPDVKKYQEWAQSNPASWGDILNKKGFNTFYNALLSSSAPFVGGIITSTITQNPIAGAAVGVAFNYMLEGQDAYSQYAQEFIEEADKMGWSHEDVANMVAAGANTYAIASSIPEFFGDVAVFKLAGLGMKSVSGIKRFSLKFAKNALKLGKEDLSKVGAQTLVDYAQENIGFGIALKAALKATGNAFLEHVAEGSTEGIQYLMEEGIGDNILNRPIDMDWLKRKVNEPEFVASVLGGAMNSVVMTAGPNLYKASGRNGTKTADRLIKYINTEVDKKSDAPQPVKDELKRFAIYKAAKSFVDNDNFNIVERIRFARRIVNNVKIKSTAESRQESATTNTQNKAEQSTQKPTDMVEDINPVANTQKAQEHTTLEKILNPNLGKVDIQGSSLNEKLIKYFVQFNDNAIKDLNSLDNKNKQKAINRLGYALEENNLNLKKDKNGNYNIDEILNKLSEMVVTEKDSGDIVDNPVAELEMQKVANKIFAEEFLGNESKEQINKLVELGVLEKDIADELLGKTVVDIEKEVAPEKHIPAEEVDWRDAYSQVKSKIRTGINKLKKVDKSLPKGLMDEYNKLGKKKTKYSEYLQLLGKTNKLLKENKLETIEQPKLKRAKSEASKPVEKTSYKKVTKSTPKEKVSNKSNIEIPEFTHKNSTEDAIALGEKYNGNKKAIEILKQKELEAKKKFDSMPKKTEEDINGRMEQSKVKQLYREAREVAEKQKETNKSQPQQATTKTEKMAKSKMTNEEIAEFINKHTKSDYEGRKANAKDIEMLYKLGYTYENTINMNADDVTTIVIYKYKPAKWYAETAPDALLTESEEEAATNPIEEIQEETQNKTQKPKPKKITVSKTYSKKDIEEELNKYIKKHDIGDIELQKETTVQNDKRLKKKILKQLQSKFPFVDIDSVDKIIDQYGGEAIAYATKMLIRYVDSKASLDTFPHEYFHIYETLFRNADFMKKAIKNVMNLLDTDEIGAREYLADYAGKYVANREKNTGILSKIKSIYKYIIANIRKLLGKYTAKDIAEIEAFKFHNIKKEKIQKAYQTYLATNTIESIIEEYQSEENKSNEDDRNGDDQEPNVKTHMDKDAGYSNIGIFIRDAGVYIPKEQYNELFKLAEQYRNKPLTNKEIRNEIVAAFREKLEELSGQKIVKRMNTAAIMSFVQKANSRVKVLREKGKWADGRLVFSIIKHTDGRISIVREADHRLDKVNQTNPAYTIEDFLEQEYRLTGIDNRVIRIPLHAIYEEHISKKSDNKYYYNIKNARKFKLTKQFVNKVNDSMGLVSLVNSKAPLLTILTSITGDNAKLLAIRVADVYKNTTREGFIANINILIRKGLFTEELKNEILASIDTLVSQNNIRDKYIWAQELGRINWLMNVKGQRFFLREKNIMDTANRLKQDIAEGTTLVGLGDTGFMTFDPKETVMTSIDPLTGEEKEIQLINDEGKYVFDGQSLTSRGLIDRANAISGFNVLDYKTVIRYLDRYSLTKFDDNGSPISGGNVDYIQFKMMEMNPFDGTKLYMKNKDGSRGELIAEYKDNYWYDKNGNKFERLLSQEEAKDRDGKFAENYVIHKIPEEATKVKFVVKDTNHSAPFPVNGPELMLNRKLVANKVYKRLVNEIKKYYAINSKQYYTALYRAINNPDFMLAMFKKKLSDNEIPDELTDILDTTMNGKVFFHPAYINQILPVINNMFIVDGAFKVRDIYGKIGSRSRSASVLIKPKGPLDIKKNSVAFGTESKSIMNYVISQIELKDKKLYDTIKTTKNIKEKSRLINDWLKDNEVHVLIHRQPIQGYTKIQPRRIQAFIPGHGNTIFMSDYDVFRVHEADFDGDKVLVDPVHDNKELINALYDYMKEEDFKSHEYIVELGMFLKPNVSGSMANMNQALHLMDYNGRLSQSQGLIVNGKTIMTVLAYKNIEVELNNGKILKPFQPDDRVIMKDFPLDPKMVEDKTIKSIIEKNGDKIKKIGDKYYLETTKQNELSIILQMAVDNKKFGFLNRLLADKQIEFRDYVLKLLFNANINKSEMSAVRAIYNLFNYSRARRGQIGKNKSSLQQILDMSKSIAELYYDLENIKESNDKFSLEPKYINDRNRFGELLKEKANNNINSRYSVTIKNIKAEPNITPMELLLSRLHLYDMNNQLNSNHYKESIMKHSDEIYEWANYKAVSELNQEYLDKLASGNIDQTKLSEALNLMKRIVNDFVSTLDTINSQKNKVATSEDTYSIPQSIYNEEMAKFIDRWYNAFNELDEDMKDWATLMFLSRYMFESGNRLKVARKRFKLLPFRLMGKNIFNEYMNKFYSHLDDQSVRQISTGDYKSDYVLNKFWRKICG